MGSATRMTSRTLPGALCLLLLLQLLSAGQAAAQTTDGGDLDPQLPGDVAQCSNVKLTWNPTTNNGSSQQYVATIVSPNAQGLVSYIGRVNDTTEFDWQAGVRAGSNISLQVTDAAGNVGTSPSVLVKEGSSSCLPIDQGSDGGQSRNDKGSGASAGLVMSWFAAGLSILAMPAFWTMA